MAFFNYLGDWPKGGMELKRQTLRADQLAACDDADDALPAASYDIAGYRFTPAAPTMVDEDEDAETIEMLRAMPHLFEEVGESA